MTRYDRYLDSDFLVDCLAPKGKFHFLISECKIINPEDPCAIDIHIRENNKLHYYHGTTRLLEVRLRESSGSLILSFRAARAYQILCPTAYKQLMSRDFTERDADKLRFMVPRYLKSVGRSSNPKYYRNRKEGYWQNAICHDYGFAWDRSKEWLVVDREAVIGYEKGSIKDRLCRDITRNCEGIVKKLQCQNPKRWGHGQKHFGQELDILAIGASGDLLCIELKHGGNAAGIYWGPLQVATYVDAFKKALDKVLPSLHRLVEQKIKLGLLPKESRSRLSLLSGNVRSLLVVADPVEESQCWKKLEDVRRLISLDFEVWQVDSNVKISRRH